VLEREFDVAMAELSKAEMDVKEKRLTVATYEQKLEESKRQLVVSEAKLVELKKNVESVRAKVRRLASFGPHLNSKVLNHNQVQKSLNSESDSKLKKPKSNLDNVPTFKPVICQKSRSLAEKFKEETMEKKLERWEQAHKKSLEVAIKIKDKDTTDWEKEVREKRMLDIARSELKLQMYRCSPRSRTVFT
jgi:hypothetical protein